MRHVVIVGSGIAGLTATYLLARDGRKVNGKSIMGVMMLAAEYGTTLHVSARGEDAEQAVDALAALVASRFGERDG